MPKYTGDTDVAIHNALAAPHAVATSVGGRTLTDIPIIVRKTADEIVNNSDVLQNDDELLFAVGANEVWDFTLHLLYNSGAVPDIMFAFTVPVAAVYYWEQISQVVGTNNAKLFIRAVGLAGDSGTADGVALAIPLFIKGIIINGANAGNVQFQWAQAVANASDTTVLANSNIIVHKLV